MNRALRSSEGGFVLILALIMMVAMTLLGIALVRSVDTATQVANNLGFKQSSLASADGGTELAVAWLAANKALLTADHADAGYYATEQAPTDFTGTATTATTDDVDWSGATGARRAFPVAAADAAGNKISYIIQRMCDSPGAYTPSSYIQCATSTANTSSSAGQSQGGASYGSYAISGKSMIYYRVTTRSVGPLNSVSYVQTMVLVEY